MTNQQLKERALAYARQRGITVLEQLGYGNDGIIWSSGRKSAIKVFYRTTSYQNERDIYRHLSAIELHEIDGFAVPSFYDCDDASETLEIALVTPPFILDFAKAYFRKPPDFSPEVLADWQAERAEWFGDKWPQVLSLLASLKIHGIWYFDAKPGNIEFAD